MNARWTSTVAGKADHELVVVRVHRVEFAVERAAHRGNGAGGGVEFEHATGAGGDEQVRALEVEVAGNRVAGQGPSVFPLKRPVGQEGALQQARSGATEVS